MIRDQWYAVLDAREVPRKKPLGVMRFGQKLVFWRDSRGEVACHVDRCCHRGVQLSIGEIRGDCIECPFHGFQFDGKGDCTLIPSNGKNAPIPKSFKLDSYPAQERYGWIWVYWGQPKAGEALPEIPYFEELKGWRHHVATFKREWGVHYTRSIENQLDIMHLAFTHKRTIGWGNRTIVDGPLFAWVDEQTLRVFPITRKEDGKPARKADEVCEEELARVFIDFKFPNIWQNHIGEKMRIFAAFVPVSEERTLTYIRTYQRFVAVPLVRELVEAAMTLLNKVILSEDERMVVTQDPIRSELEMDELLVRGDLPIVEYRKRRQQLKEAASAPPTITGRTNAAFALAKGGDLAA